ncbi:MAG: hypothetical protein ACJAUY_002067 [Cognaticolwellia sp.]|jgi:hypothetical protein|nr:hypothetical protein DBO93_08655 [Colwellia sp. Arc7-D]
MTNFIPEFSYSNVIQLKTAFANLLTDKPEALSSAYKLICRRVFNINSSALVKKLDLKAV